MKKIVRVIVKTLLTMLILVVDIFIINKIFQSDISEIIQIVLFLIIVAITIVLGVSLMSNPTMKVNLFKKKVSKIRVEEKTSEFVQICNLLMDEYGNELEKYRHRVIKYIIILVMLLVIEFIITIIVVQFVEVKIENLIVLYLLPTLIVVWKMVKTRKQFFEEYKKKIIKELVNIVNGKLSYEYDGNNQICSKYMDANFGEEEFNTFETTDYINGKINDNIGINLAKISLLNCSESGEEINRVDTFLFAYNIVNFVSPNEVRIKKNRIINLDNNKVEMDSEEFEKYFDVISDSHLTAMQILSHDVMREIAYFYEKYKLNFEIVIKENKIYIKFETGDVFNPSLLKKVVDNDLLWIYYNVLNFTISLSRKINKVLEGLEF